MGLSLGYARACIARWFAHAVSPRQDTRRQEFPPCGLCVMGYYPLLETYYSADSLNGIRTAISNGYSPHAFGVCGFHAAAEMARGCAEFVAPNSPEHEQGEIVLRSQG